MKDFLICVIWPTCLVAGMFGAKFIEEHKAPYSRDAVAELSWYAFMFGVALFLTVAIPDSKSKPDDSAPRTGPLHRDTDSRGP